MINFFNSSYTVPDMDITTNHVLDNGPRMAETEINNGITGFFSWDNEILMEPLDEDSLGLFAIEIPFQLLKLKNREAI